METLEEKYYSKALESYQNKEYKYCLILLKKVDLRNVRNVGLYVNCAYDYWKEIYLTDATLHRSQAFAATSERRSILYEQSLGSSIADSKNEKQRERDEKETLLIREGEEDEYGAMVLPTISPQDDIVWDSQNHTENGPSAIGGDTLENDEESMIEQSQHVEGLFKDSANRPATSDIKFVRAAVQESFTHLLANAKILPISAYDYVRLTHVYLAEGSLDGALRILQLASARGYLEDPLIILQSWTIMRRISSDRAAHESMQYLVSTLILEANQRKRNPARPISPGIEEGLMTMEELDTWDFNNTLRSSTMGSPQGTGFGRSGAGINNSRSFGAGAGFRTLFSPTSRPNTGASGTLGGAAGFGSADSFNHNHNSSFNNTFHSNRSGSPNRASNLNSNSGFQQLFSPDSRGGSPSRMSRAGTAASSANGARGAGDIIMMQQQQSPSSRPGTTGSASFLSRPGSKSAKQQRRRGDVLSRRSNSRHSRSRSRPGADGQPLPQDTRDEGYFVSGSDLPMEVLYLHCATYVHKQALNSTHNAKKLQLHMGEYSSILAEAYFMSQGAINEDVKVLHEWANDPDVWLQMGMMLDFNDTPYVLLAQDSYWEAFIRHSLDDTALKMLVEAMAKTNRSQDIPALLGRVMHANQWNLYARQMLKEIELDAVYDRDKQHWRQLFESEDRDCTKVQACIRGWRLRRHWSEIYAKAYTRLTKYRERKQEAIKRCLSYWIDVRRRLMVRWREYVEDYKAQQYHAATRLQAFQRMRVTYFWYQWEKQRIYTANMQYILVCQQQHDYRRQQHFRAWHGEYMKRLQQRSADLLINVLFMNGYSRLLRNGMDFVLSVMRVKRRYLYRRTLRFWHERQQRRYYNRARITIRFFIRSVYARIRLAEQEARMKELEKVMEEKTQVDFKKNYTPLMREKWDIWYGKYRQIVLHHMLIQLSVNLARMFYRRRGRAMLRVIRARRESQRAFVTLTWHRKLCGIIFPWQREGAARRIQRKARVHAAYRKLRRLERIREGVEDMRNARRERNMQHSLWCWHKYNYLQRRERIRAAKRVVKMFRRLVMRGRLGRCNLKKLLARNLLEATHKAHLHVVMRRFQLCTVNASKLRIMTSFFATAWRGVLRCAFHRWRYRANAQWLVDRVIHATIVRPIECRFWSGCTTSTTERLLPSSSSLVDAGVASVPDLTNVDILRYGDTAPHHVQTLNQQCQPFEPRYKSWEDTQNSHPTTVLYQLSTAVAMQKAFKVWRVCYRLRRRYLRGTLQARAHILVARAVRGVAVRRGGVTLLQCTYRKYRARQTYQALLRRRIRHVEISQRLSSDLQFHYWHRMQQTAHLRRQARLALQCAIRCSLARRDLLRRQAYEEQLRDLYRVVNRSAIQRSICLKYMRIMQLMYCRSAHKGLLQLRENASNASTSKIASIVHISSFSLNTLRRKAPKKKTQKSGGGSRHVSSSSRFNGGGGYDDDIEDGGIEGMGGDEDDGDATDPDDDDDDQEGGDLNDIDDEFMTDNERRIRDYERRMRKREKQKKKSKSKQSERVNPIQGNLKASRSVDTLSKPKTVVRKYTQLQKKPYYDPETLKNPSFKSEECHRQLQRLQESGIFIYDAATMAGSDSDAIAPQQQQQQLTTTGNGTGTGKLTGAGAPGVRSVGMRKSILTSEEIEFCLQHADTVFVQGTRKGLVKNVIAHVAPVGPKKLVFCGGQLTHDVVADLLAGFLRRRWSHGSAANGQLVAAPGVALPEQQKQQQQQQQQYNVRIAEDSAVVGGSGSGSGEDDPSLVLHLISVKMGMAARLSFILNILDAPPPPSPTLTFGAGISGAATSSSSLSRVAELAIDTETVGVLGAAILLRCIEFNRCLRSLSLKFSVEDEGEGRGEATSSTRSSGNSTVSGRVLHCYVESIHVLSRNCYLQELRLFGAVLPVVILQALSHTLQPKHRTQQHQVEEEEEEEEEEERVGFPALRVLEFSLDAACSDSVAAAESIIEVAKDRTYAGRNGGAGLSVTTQYR